MNDYFFNAQLIISDDAQTCDSEADERQDSDHPQTHYQSTSLTAGACQTGVLCACPGTVSSRVILTTLTNSIDRE